MVVLMICAQIYTQRIEAERARSVFAVPGSDIFLQVNAGSTTYLERRTQKFELVEKEVLNPRDTAVGVNSGKEPIVVGRNWWKRVFESSSSLELPNLARPLVRGAWTLMKESEGGTLYNRRNRVKWVSRKSTVDQIALSPFDGTIASVDFRSKEIQIETIRGVARKKKLQIPSGFTDIEPAYPYISCEFVEVNKLCSVVYLNGKRTSHSAGKILGSSTDRSGLYLCSVDISTGLISPLLIASDPGSSHSPVEVNDYIACSERGKVIFLWQGWLWKVHLGGM